MSNLRVGFPTVLKTFTFTPGAGGVVVRRLGFDPGAEPAGVASVATEGAHWREKYANSVNGEGVGVSIDVQERCHNPHQLLTVPCEKAGGHQVGLSQCMLDLSNHFRLQQ